MTKEIQGKEKVLLGKNKDGKSTYITKPKWNCDWYWSFGYLGNSNCHYHLESYARNPINYSDYRNENMYNCLLLDYELSDKIKENLWQFCELAKTIYSLKETAEVLGRGGSYYTTNPCQDVIKDTEYTKHLNDVVLPKVMQTFWDLIGGNQQ